MNSNENPPADEPYWSGDMRVKNGRRQRWVRRGARWAWEYEPKLTPARVAGPGEVVMWREDVEYAAEFAAFRFTDAAERLRAALAAQSEPATDEPTSVPGDFWKAKREAGWPEPLAPEPADQGEGMPIFYGDKRMGTVTPAPPADRTPDAATLPDTPNTVIEVVKDGQTVSLWRLRDDEETPWRTPGGRKLTDREVADLARMQSYTILAEPPKGEVITADMVRTMHRDFTRARATGPASGQPKGDTEPDYGTFGFIVPPGVSNAIKAAEDRAVARIRAEGYIAVDTLVKALRDEMDTANASGALKVGAFASHLAGRIAQAGQQHTEKEDDA